MDLESQPLTLGQIRSDREVATEQPRTGSLHLEEQGYINSPVSGSSSAPGVLNSWRESPLWVRGATLISAVLFVVATATLAVVGVTGGLYNRHTGGGGSVSFFVVGDWGRQGSTNQSAVASLMGKRAAALRPQFIVSTGDNMYPNGLNSSLDPLFDLSFSKVYTAPGLQVPWHAVLGNHDYGDGFEYCVNDATSPCQRSPKFQLGVELRQRDWRWHCERLYTETFADGAVQLFFMDTNPFLEENRIASWAAYDGGIAQQSWEAQLRELEQQLAASTAAWRLMIGHHPPRSNGHHGNNTELMDVLEPLLERYGVQAYFSGHDHNLEHLHPVPEVSTHYFVSGGGSDCDRGFEGRSAASLFQYPASGFAAVGVKGDRMKVDFYTLESQLVPAYSYTVARQL